MMGHIFISTVCCLAQSIVCYNLRFCSLLEKVLMLEVNNLFCERDERVLFSGLSFNVQQREIVQIEGQNGSGKTTLLRILCGLCSAYQGEICWQGQAVEAVREDYFASLLYVGHQAGVKAALTPTENLHWMSRLHPALNLESIEQALDDVGLYGYEDVPCHMLSAGQQRRVGLARLHMSNAPLWILDEPFTALDKKGVAEKEALLSGHIKQGGSVILTTHHDLRIPDEQVRSINLDTLVQR